MATLKRQHAFRRWAPDIGENRDLKPEPALWFELATGLTAEQLKGILVRMDEPIAETPEGIEGEALVSHVRGEIRRRYLEAFARGYVRVVGGPHSIGGKELLTIDDYFGIVEAQADRGKTAITDLFTALLQFNSFGGPDELFSPRRSGGLASTASPSAAKTEPKTEGP